MQKSEKVQIGEHLTSNGRKAIETGIILLIDQVVAVMFVK